MSKYGDCKVKVDELAMVRVVKQFRDLEKSIRDIRFKIYKEKCKTSIYSKRADSLGVHVSKAKSRLDDILYAFSDEYSDKKGPLYSDEEFYSRK